MPTVFDELPYSGSPFVDTHPDRLATVATLFGLEPPPVNRSRVLELGCGDGGNLIPMAFALPHSSFAGIDLSATAIARGLELVHHLQLPNVRLHPLDLLDVDSTLGEFDYIIAHGLYSWVPPQAREHILHICGAQLAPNGIAYISFNAYPGGHLRDAIRNMLLFHVRDCPGPREKSDHVRELLEFLVEFCPGKDPYSLLLQSELQSFLERSPAHFFHDELSEYNDRFYFHEFVRDASRHGLQFVSDARIHWPAVDLPPPAMDKLHRFIRDDDLAREQYLDFAQLRNFRRSLLCRSEVPLKRSLDPSQLNKLYVASDVSPVSAEESGTSASPQEFRFSSGGRVSTNHPLGKAALLHLGRIWPASAAFPDLLQTAKNPAGRDSPSGDPSSDDDASWLADMLLKLHVAKFAELHAHAPVCAAQVSERPVASALARGQLRYGSHVTNLRHAQVSIDDDCGRLLLSLLDGSRGRSELLAAMRGPCEEVTAERLESSLNGLARMSLLQA